MPVTVTSKSPEDAKKKCVEEPKKVESSNSIIKEKKSKCGDTMFPSPPGDGEIQPKKPVSKKRVGEEKKSGTPVTDKLPKTKAQRAKGSTSLNKTIDAIDTGLPKNKHTPSRSNDGLAVSAAKEVSEVRKTPVTVRNKTRTKAEVDVKNGKKRKPWVAVVEKESEVSINEKTVEVVEEAQLEEIDPEIRISPPGNTCSFFEKLQQGVKAYFTSRNSFNPLTTDDKNKKKVSEGGIRTRARIAKGVKEDHKKRKPGKKVKDKKYKANGGLRDDRFRLMLNVGGISNISLSAKPKIIRHFQTLKRKKLYRPIKHCVRIQIPRKGYFYRSTVQFKTPGSVPSLQRVESTMPKSKSKVQISGLAPTSPKISSLLKKRVKKVGKIAQSIDSEANVPHLLSLLRVEYPNLVLDDKVSNLEEKVSEYLTSKLPGCRSFLNNEGKSSGKINPQEKKESQIGAILENSVSCSSPLTKSQVKKKLKGNKKLSFPNGADDASEILEVASERIISTVQNEKRPPQTFEASFNTLFNCINRMLGNDERFCGLEITPITTGGGEFSVENDFQVLRDVSAVQNFPPAEAVTTFDNFQNTIDTPEEPFSLSPLTHITCVSQNDGDHQTSSEGNIAKVLIGEIDLHLELENYLETLYKCNSVKSKTKNTPKSNMLEDYHSLNNSNEDEINFAGEFFDSVEDKSNSAFESASSLCNQQGENKNKQSVLFDQKCDRTFSSEEFDSRNSKAFIPQSQLMEKIDDFRIIKSEYDPKEVYSDGKIRSWMKRSFGKTSFHSLQLDDENPGMLSSNEVEHMTDSSISSYEKIQPFITHFNKSCDEFEIQGNHFNKNLGCSFSAESLALNSKDDPPETGVSRYKLEPSECFEWDEEGMAQVLEKSISNHNMNSYPPPCLKLKKWKWSPTLQELIQIYKSVLRQNKIIRSNSKNLVNGCISSHLFSFLNDKLKEQEYKANLVKISKALQKRVESLKTWRPGRRKEANYLKEYVAMFQEVLQSSLTINQISRLNKVISDLQNFSEKNFDLVRNYKQLEENKNTKIEKEEKMEELSHSKIVPPPKTEMQPQPSPLPAKKPKVKTPIKEAAKQERTEFVKPAAERRERTQNEKAKSQQSVLTKNSRNIELPSPMPLESILKPSYHTDGIDKKGFSKDFNEKILVNVELYGNQLLVNGLSYFKNEESLTPIKTKNTGTSELIIENVTKEPLNDGLQKTKSKKNIRRAEQINLYVPQQHKNQLRVKSSRGPRRMKNSSKTEATAASKKIKETYSEKYCDNFLLKEKQDPSPVRFEYDQILLRTQHPIEAILERSESKLSEIIESSEDNRSAKFIPEKIILQTDIHNEPVVKESLNELMTGNVFSKDLICDFDWRCGILNKSPYTINQKTMKSQQITRKKVKGIKTVKSLLDLKNSYKSRKKRRHINSFTCFPSISSSERAAPLKKPMKQGKQSSLSPLSMSQMPNFGSQYNFGQMKTNSKEVNVEEEKSESEIFSNLEQGTGAADDVSVLINKEVALKCSSSDLLYNNKSINSKIIPKESSHAMAPYSQVSVENVFVPVEQNNSNPGGGSALIDNDVKDSSIVILSTKDISESLSNSSINIHSDSFLKCFPLTFAPDNYCFLFKSSSDMKFYPGRINNEEKEKTPFVKFVLTPSQNADAGLPPEQVEVVDKRLATEKFVNDDSSKTERAEASSEDFNKEVSLVSIEKFIRQLSKIKKKEKPKLNKQTKTEFGIKQLSTNPVKPWQMKKLSVSNQKSNLKVTERKPYHECQIRRLANKKKRSESKPNPKLNKSKAMLKKSKPMPNKPKPIVNKPKPIVNKPKPIVNKPNPIVNKPRPVMNKQKPVTNKPKPILSTIISNDGLNESDSLELNNEQSTQKGTINIAEADLISLRSFVSIFLKLLNSYKKFSNEKIQTEIFKECKTGESDRNITCTTKLDCAVKGHMEKATNTTPEKKCSFTRVLDSTVEAPHLVRSANTQTEDIINMREQRVREHESQIVKQCMNCDHFNHLSKFSSETSLPRKPKNVKIKIHCENHKNTMNTVRTFEKDNPQHRAEEIEPLDLLLTKDPETATLKRLDSVYFDAIDFFE